MDEGMVGAQVPPWIVTAGIKSYSSSLNVFTAAWQNEDQAFVLVDAILPGGHRKKAGRGKLLGSWAGLELSSPFLILE